MEPDEVPQHRARLVERTVTIILAHPVLLQKVVLQHPRHLQRDLVVLAQRALPHQLHDLGKIVLLLQNLLRLRAQVDEAGFGGLVVWLENFGVLGVGDVPVDGGEMFPLGEFLVETPEDLHDTERGGRDRVGEVTAWRRNAIYCFSISDMHE